MIANFVYFDISKAIEKETENLVKKLKGCLDKYQSIGMQDDSYLKAIWVMSQGEFHFEQIS